MDFKLDWLHDPEIFSVNCIAPHSSHSYVKENGVSCTLSLDGEWDFNYAQSFADYLTPEKAFVMSSSEWDTIKVPSAIQLCGNGKYGTPHYVNNIYPWDGHEKIIPGEVPLKYNPIGTYAKTFTVPDNFNEDYVYIRFDGADAAIAVFCNNKFIGYSEDSFTPAEFKLSGCLNQGENRLVVQVFRFCSGSWLEDQDFWRLSGLFRSVTLFTHPKVHIWDINANATLDKNLQTGHFTVHCKIEGEGKITLNFGDESVCSEILNGEAIVYIKVQNPLLWSAEAPNLYEYTLTATDKNGNLCEKVNEYTAFRRFEIDNGLMVLNNKRIVFNGVNRHEWSCTSARTLTRDDMLKDVINLKRNNINAVRTSHYPNDIYFYELCDRFGIYVMDETNLETHGTWQISGNTVIDENTIPNDKPQWSNIILHRAKNVLERDKNHPCILIWSCGNESGGGENIYKMSQYFRSADSSRLVHYEGVAQDRRFNDTSDMESRMYLPANEIQEYLLTHNDKPFISCEYSHAMGNSNGSMEEYTTLARTQPLYQGGFIWDYIDQGLIKKDSFGNNYLAYGGDFGDTPTDYNFCVNGIVYANRQNSPKMQEVRFNYSPFFITITKTHITIDNLFLFTDLSEFDIKCELCINAKNTQSVMINASASPCSATTLKNPFSIVDSKGIISVTIYILTKCSNLWASKGHCVAQGQLVYGQYNRINAANPDISICEGNANIGVCGKNFEVLFSRDNGFPVCYLHNGKNLLGPTPPRFEFWRASTDNDRGANLPFIHAHWYAAGQFAKLISIDIIEKTKISAVICARFTLAMPQLYEVELQYTINGNGKIEIKATWLSEQVYVPKFALIFFMPEEYKHVRYLGNGPEECYCDRSKGALFGEYRYERDENISQYVIPQECGNRTGVYCADITNHNNAGLRFEADTMECSVLPYTPAELEQARHHYELPSKSKTVVQCAFGQTGIGGDNSWGATAHPQYNLRLEHGTQFKMSLGLIDK